VKNILQRAREIKGKRESFDHGCNCKHAESRNLCGNGRTTAVTAGKCANNIPHSTLKTPAQKAIRKTFKISTHLANLLPTGTVLVFQIMSPIFTH
jgi:hypothetical protein